jgi:hypothetical protein
VLSVVATLATAKILPWIGPRLPITVGMLIAAAGMVMLTGVGVHSTYAANVLPALIVIGAGIGLVMAPAMNSGTLGVASSDAGVASATVNTMQQVGGSVGTALLSTLAASATSGFMAGKQPGAGLLAQAAVHGYTTAFWWSAGIFALGAIVCGLLLRPGVQAAADPAAEPVLVH